MHKVDGQHQTVHCALFRSPTRKASWLKGSYQASINIYKVVDVVLIAWQLPCTGHAAVLPMHLTAAQLLM
jgi:hypothetical protein